jgi:hypothetical protein
MKATPLFLSILCLLLLLPLSVIAQENDDRQNAIDGERAMNEIMVSRITRAAFEQDPSGAFMVIFAAGGKNILPGFNEEFGISDEQIARIGEAMDSRQPEDWEGFEKMFKGIEEKLLEDAHYNLTEEEDEAIKSMISYSLEATNEVAEEVFTVEQIQQMDGMMLALTGGLESPFFNERHMDALEMTDEQKKQFQTINEATSPGRDKLIAAIKEETLKMMDGGKVDFKGWLGTFAKFREYSRDLKQRRMAVLTQEQVAKAAKLVRLPKFLSVANLLQEVWTPGPNSWKPGDPLPEGFVPPQPSKRNFPRRE